MTTTTKKMIAPSVLAIVVVMIMTGLQAANAQTDELYHLQQLAKAAGAVNSP